MDALAVVMRLHEHRRWVNGLLLDKAAVLPSDQLRGEFAIGQGSVWRSLVHLYAAEYVWLETLLGNPAATLPGDRPDRLPGNQEGEERAQTLEELREAWSQLETRWVQYLNDLSNVELDKAVPRISTNQPNKPPRFTRRIDVLLHVCTHAHYTTAQVINMLRHLGVEQLPDIMLISLARSQHPDNQ